MMVLYFGGQKSGKSRLAEEAALALCEAPVYIATYDNSYGDEEMQKRIRRHRERRQAFSTLEEPVELASAVEAGNTYLIDCVSMWLLNTLERDLGFLKEQLHALARSGADIVFVLNETTCGVIPANNQSRKFIDRTGIIGQELVELCDEVYEVKFGLKERRK